MSFRNLMSHQLLEFYLYLLHKLNDNFFIVSNTLYAIDIIYTFKWNEILLRGCTCAQSCPTLCNPMNWSRQAPLSMEFPGQEYWSGVPFPSPEGLPDPGIKPGLPHCKQMFSHLSHQGSRVTDKWILSAVIIILTIIIIQFLLIHSVLSNPWETALLPSHSDFS